MNFGRQKKKEKKEKKSAAVGTDSIAYGPDDSIKHRCVGVGFELTAGSGRVGSRSSTLIPS